MESRYSSQVLGILLVGVLSLSFVPPLARDRAEATRRTELVRHDDPEVADVMEFLDERKTGLSDSEIAELAPLIVAETRAAEISLDLVLALIHIESSGNNYAHSTSGALGLMQLRPSTARAVALDTGIEWDGPSTLFDPARNVTLGIRYLAQLIERFGDLPTALAAYNWGPTRIADWLRRGQNLPTSYSDRVLATRTS